MRSPRGFEHQRKTRLSSGTGRATCACRPALRGGRWSKEETRGLPAKCFRWNSSWCSSQPLREGTFLRQKALVDASTLSISGSSLFPENSDKTYFFFHFSLRVSRCGLDL